MEGVVDHHMRRTLTTMHTADGHAAVDICVTEFIRVTDHLLPRRVFLRSCPELDKKALDKNLPCPVRVQLLGSNPEALAANALRAAEMGAPAIDLNFGCPAKTVNRHRGGACLLDDTELLATIVRQVRNNVPGSIPVTVKIRLGYENRDSYLKNAKAIEAAGASELIVHARSKADGYRPPAYWDCIGEIRNALTIPVVANGEIWSLEDFLLCQQQSGCTDIMLGRGLLAKPDLALEIKHHMAGLPHTPLSWHQVTERLLRFFLDTCDDYPEKYIGNRVKQWLHYLQRTYPRAQTLFDAIKGSRDRYFLQQQLQLELNIPQ